MCYLLCICKTRIWAEIADVLGTIDVLFVNVTTSSLAYNSQIINPVWSDEYVEWEVKIEVKDNQDLKD